MNLKTPLAVAAALAFIPALQAAEHVSEVLTIEDLMEMQYEQVNDHTLKAQTDNLTVEVLQGKQAAIEYLMELQAEFELINSVEKNRNDFDREGKILSDLKTTVALLEEISALENMIEADNWDESASKSSTRFSNQLCATDYHLDFEIRRAFFRYILEVTTTTDAVGVGPIAPSTEGWIKAKAIIRPQGPNLVKQSRRVDFDSTWLQSHSVSAEVNSGLHSSSTIIPWKAVSVLSHTGTSCTGLSVIRVWGENSYSSPVVITDTEVE